MYMPKKRRDPREPEDSTPPTPEPVGPFDPPEEVRSSHFKKSKKNNKI